MLKTDTPSKNLYVEYVNQLVSAKIDPTIFSGGLSQKQQDEFVESVARGTWRVIVNEKKVTISRKKIFEFQIKMAGSFSEWLTIRQQLPQHLIDSSADFFMQSIEKSYFRRRSTEHKFLTFLFFQTVKELDSGELAKLLEKKRDEQSKITKTAYETNNIFSKILKNLLWVGQHPMTHNIISVCAGLAVVIPVFVIACKTTLFARRYLDDIVVPLTVSTLKKHAPLLFVQVAVEINQNRPLIVLIIMLGARCFSNNFVLLKKLFIFTDYAKGGISNVVISFMFRKIAYISFFAGFYTQALVHRTTLRSSMIAKTFVEKRIVEPAEQWVKAREIQEACDLWVGQVQKRDNKTNSVK